MSEVAEGIQQARSSSRMQTVVGIGNSVGITLSTDYADHITTDDFVFVEDTDDPHIKRLHLPRDD